MPIILTCTDGSLYAPSIYDHSAWAAKRLKVPIHVLHTVDPRREATPLADLSGSIGLDAQVALSELLIAADEARGRAAQAKANAILKDARQYLANAGVAEVDTDAKHGALVDVIQDYKDDTELVVIGKRGESADFAKMHPGANLERVIRGCSHPVLVASRKFKPIERILIAYDGGPSARKAIDYATSRPLLNGLTCHLLSVGKPSQSIAEDLGQATERLRATGYAVEAKHVSGEPEDVIATTVKESAIDLLVMGAYGHSRIRQLFVGSTTSEMIRTCRVPVLMFH